MHDFTGVLSPGCTCQTRGQETHCGAQRGPRQGDARRPRGPGGQRRADLPRPGSGERSPGAHLHEFVLVEAERVRPLGQVHPTFLHPAGRRLSAPRHQRGKEAGGCVHGRGGHSYGQLPPHRRHRFRQHGSARAAANERGRRGPASACRRQEGCADRCLRASPAGRAAPVRRRAALQPRARSCWAAQLGPRGSHPVPPFPLGKIYCSALLGSSP